MLDFTFDRNNLLKLCIFQIVIAFLFFFRCEYRAYEPALWYLVAAGGVGALTLYFLRQKPLWELVDGVVMFAQIYFWSRWLPSRPTLLFTMDSNVLIGFGIGFVAIYLLCILIDREWEMSLIVGILILTAMVGIISCNDYLKVYDGNLRKILSYEPRDESYAVDMAINIKVYYQMEKGNSFYQSWYNAFKGDTRFDEPQAKAINWRIPTLFTIWKILIPGRGEYILYLFTVMIMISMGCMFLISIRFLPPSLALLAPTIFMPFVLYSVITYWFLQTEWWSVQCLLWGLTAYLYDRKWITMICFTFALAIRELAVLFLGWFTFAMFLQKRWKDVVILVVIPCVIVTGIYIGHLHNLEPWIHSSVIKTLTDVGSGYTGVKRVTIMQQVLNGFDHVVETVSEFYGFYYAHSKALPVLLILALIGIWMVPDLMMSILLFAGLSFVVAYLKFWGWKYWGFMYYPFMMMYATYILIPFVRGIKPEDENSISKTK